MNKIEIFDCVCRKLCQYFVFCILLCIFHINDDRRSKHNADRHRQRKMLSGNLCQYFNSENITFKTCCSKTNN